ncbi:Oidioi.mRNA.OKI2018_I69.PAR.g12733.t1.cds [Oikopleura dioica]|uniref:Oidioi.mRNA.OKI2018_I69.PAR.g12733.t1.cds n=1 Tax=Oikopleura dioica TaxID=34765 RepID=A0ABN7S5C4_OIKDI|nr:Oidioi.mRNA.OKI2018_I69.PAR.g12733.t1.cds [Oikopleura dioica]
MLSEGGFDDERPKIKFVKKSYETMAEFKDRMHAECQNAITIANGTKARNVVKEFKKATKLDKNNGKIPEEQKPKQKAINRKRLEKKQIEKEKKSDKELERLEKEMLKDRVEFGERVDAPPEFKSLPRGAQKKTTGRFSNLLLLEKLQLPEHQVEQKQQQKTREEELAEERKRAIEEYRKLRTIRT